MAEPFLGEIRLFGFYFNPRYWAKCEGQILPINQNQSLFSLLGTTYGGDGRTSFGLPDFRGRTAIHAGAGSGLPTYQLGQRGGDIQHTVITAHMPAHNHTPQASSATADQTAPDGKTWGKTTPLAYSSAPPDTLLSTAAISPTGGNAAHSNLQPYLVLNYCIAIRGIFPSRS